MLNLAAHRKDRTVALAAVVILLLQAFFTAWTTGAMASGAMPLDAWGNPLCITASEDGSSTSGDVAIPNCCAMGCGMSATVLPAPNADSILLRTDRPAATASFPVVRETAKARLDHDPGSPRAPPLTV